MLSTYFEGPTQRQLNGNGRLARHALGQARLGRPAGGSKTRRLAESQTVGARHPLQIQRRERQHARRDGGLAAASAGGFCAKRS